MSNTLGLEDQPQIRQDIAGLPSYVPGRKPRSTLVAALASNESHFAPLPSVQSVVSREAGRINRYPDFTGEPLRREIASRLQVSADEVTPGPGSSGVLQQIIDAMCVPGDEVIFAWRSFEAYPLMVVRSGATPVMVPLQNDEHHDLEQMTQRITAATRVIILCSPNNPTGVSISPERLSAFLKLVPRQVLVVLDEAYIEFSSMRSESLNFYRRHPNLCLLRTFSKAHGLAGLRVGFSISRPKLAEGFRRTCIPFAISALAQQAAIASLAAEDEMNARVTEIVRERERAIASLRQVGWQIPDSDANFYWIRATDRLRESITSALFEEDIIIRGYAEDGVRISLADRTTNDRVIAALADKKRFSEEGL